MSEKVEPVLADDSLDAEDAGPLKCEAIEALLHGVAWSDVLDHLLRVLRQPERRRSDWDTVAEVLWGAMLDGRQIPVDTVVAHLCYRGPPGSDENNLAWSIIAKLKRAITFRSTIHCVMQVSGPSWRT